MDDTNSLVPCYLILHSVSKRHNIGSLLRCCTAFGVDRVSLCLLSCLFEGLLKTNSKPQGVLSRFAWLVPGISMALGAMALLIM